MKAVKRYKKGGKMCSCGKMPAGMCDCGGKMGKYKEGGKFPDLTGDGKVTQADILKGRGVFKNGGLYDNIHAKRARGERMRKPGEKGAPTAQDFKNAAKTAKK